jgi:RND family efflux transporter MFP subunit
MQTRQDFESESITRPSGEAPKTSHRGFLILVVVLVVVVLGSVLFGYMQRQTHDRALAATASEDAGRPLVVNVGRVRSSAAKASIELPGETVALIETPMYARVDGYLKQRNVDIGDRVKKGQLLAEIETPELDQQVAQAQSTLAQSRSTLQQLTAALAVSKSNMNLAKLTADRYKKLVEDGSVAKQDADEKFAQLDVAVANVRQAEENLHAAEGTIGANSAALQRLEQMKSFNRLLAPFDGIITGRSVQSDPGTLVTAGNTTQSRDILRVAQIEKLRIFVNVPQTYAPMIHPGQTGDLIIDEFPGQTFPAKVSRTTNSVDATSRTLLAVLVVDNPTGKLLPGMYAKVRFSLPHEVKVMMLPADALVLKTSGPSAAVVGPDRKIHFHALVLGRDYGAQIEVNSGVEENDAVVLNPTDSIRENVVVDPREQKK